MDGMRERRSGVAALPARMARRAAMVAAGILGIAAIAGARWAIERMRYLAEYGGDDGA